MSTRYQLILKPIKRRESPELTTNLQIEIIPENESMSAAKALTGVAEKVVSQSSEVVKVTGDTLGKFDSRNESFAYKNR